MLRIIKNVFVRITVLLIVIAGLLLGFAFQDGLMEAGDRVVAYYYVYLGDKKYQKRKLQDAIDYYNKALALYPGHYKARYNLGNIYVTYEDYESAELCYKEALKYKPDYLNARINLAIIQTEQLLNFDEAIKNYQIAINTNPLIIKIPFIYNNEPSLINKKAVAYYNMGLAYRGQSLLYAENPGATRRFLEKAAHCYRNALKFEPDNYETHYNLALTLHLLKNLTEAHTEYCKAIELEPLNYEAHYNLAILLKEMKNYAASASELEKAGLILDSRGDGYKTAYIYAVLSEVNERASIQKDYDYLVERIDDEPAKPTGITYLNGKVVITDELDKAILENMKNCESCKISKRQED